MTTATEIRSEILATEIKQMLLGQKCWYVGCGGCVGTTFQFALGKKIRRPKLLKNPTASREFQQFEGERGLLVWCSWRLERAGLGMTSSEDEQDARRDEALRSLAGRTIERVTIETGWYLRVDFDDQSVLTVFPDHVGPSAIIDTNWEVWLPERRYAIDSDLNCVVEPRQTHVIRPGAIAVPEIGRRYPVEKAPVIRMRNLKKQPLGRARARRHRVRQNRSAESIAFGT